MFTLRAPLPVPIVGILINPPIAALMICSCLFRIPVQPIEWTRPGVMYTGLKSMARFHILFCRAAAGLSLGMELCAVTIQA
jgi:hypothetical protein